MNQIYFEAKGEALLERIGMSKSEFARQMGIRKQNVKALFKTKNLQTIYKASEVLGVPFEMLVRYIEEPDLSEIPIAPYEEEVTTANNQSNTIWQSALAKLEDWSTPADKLFYRLNFTCMAYLSSIEDPLKRAF